VKRARVKIVTPRAFSAHFFEMRRDRYPVGARDRYPVGARPLSRGGATAIPWGRDRYPVGARPLLGAVVASESRQN